MNPSLSISDFSSGPQPAFLSFHQMGQLVRTKRLFSDRGVRVEGRALVDLASVQRMVEAEDAINSLALTVRDKGKRQEKSMALDAALRMAKDSNNGHELNYLASMFINQPKVLRQLAKNPNLPDSTQRMLINDAKASKDMHVIRNLAYNPAVKPQLMRDILQSFDDAIVRHQVASNAAQKAHIARDREDPYVKLCDELADTTYDSALRLVVLPSVRDPAVLRKIARSRDTVLGASELEAVAANIHTPADVLAEMANVSPLRRMVQSAFGVTVAQTAARTLQDLRHPEDRIEAAGPM
ncbi:hypothetical protein [Ralstonia sp. ASV6]|uniref:hypothetical protein n=1 Tax=Ralstonia sp. ASV6 TaxID=2795124 RepID=UPI0018ED461F|nr:hypothetical protein [Ralstonia sp. ASV6]